MERDPTLRRIVFNSAVITIGVAAVALASESGGLDRAIGVLAGAGLMAFSYRVIRQSVDARTDRVVAEGGNEGLSRRAGIASAAWTLTKYVTRYGVIAVAAWVVLVPLHASAGGVFAGVSAPVAAIALEAFKKRR